MATTLDRFSGLLVGWVPDLSRLPVRRQVALGGILALLAHLLLIPLLLLLLVLSELIFPRHEESLPRPESQNLEVEIRPAAPAAAPQPAFEDRRKIIDPRGMEASLEKPEHPVFESDRDMRAGSEQPANGVLPLPSQEGRTDYPSQDFADQDVRVQLTEHATAAAVIAPTEQPAVETSAPPPLYKPQPVSDAALAAAQKAPPTAKLPEPAKATRATPPPMEKVAMLRPDQIAVTRPAEITAPGPVTRLETPTPPPKSVVTKEKPDWMPQMSLPRDVAKTASPQYREQLRKTQVEGSISNRGKPGVDAVATPAGRWSKMMDDAIGNNWNLLLSDKSSLLSGGNVRVSFRVNEKGGIAGLRVQAGSGNALLDDLCLQAIRKTAINPPPEEVVAPMPNRELEHVVDFHYLLY